MSAAPDPHLSTIERQIQEADNYSHGSENVGRNIGVNKLVQIVEQEPALVRLDSGPAFEPVFQQSQGARPREKFSNNPPDKRNDMQPPEERTRARQEGAKDHPQDEERVHDKDGSCECRIETSSKNECTHCLESTRLEYSTVPPPDGISITVVQLPRNILRNPCLGNGPQPLEGASRCRQD